jgi:hypothetical protein
MKRQAPRGQKREKELTDRFGCDFDELAVWDLDGKPLNEQAKHFDATRAKEGKKKEGGRMKLIARRGKSVYLVEIDEETGHVDLVRYLCQNSGLKPVGDRPPVRLLSPQQEVQVAQHLPLTFQLPQPQQLQTFPVVRIRLCYFSLPQSKRIPLSVTNNP